MATLPQIQANRRNSQNSTGPRSAEGKAVSSMNALKSGIDAKASVIRGEKAANLETLKSEYYDRFHPTTPEQRMLLDILIDSEWLLRRFRAAEAELWDAGSEPVLRDVVKHPLGVSLQRGCVTFTRLQRRIDTAQRNYRTALQDLKRLQAEPAPEPAPALSPEPAPQSQTPIPQNQPLTSKIGFVPHAAPVGPNPPIDSPVPDPVKI